MYYYGARYYDPRISLWLSTDPLQEKYPNISTYAYCVQNPIKYIDPNGKDIIFILDREAAAKQGHIAVLIGNEKNGWKYVSINGVGTKSAPYGKSRNPDLGVLITDETGKIISDPNEAVLRTNDINPNSSVTHSYDSYKRIESSLSEDLDALDASIKVAKTKIYGVAGPGKSCMDVAQAAFKTLIDNRDMDTPWYLAGDNIPGESDLIPKNWFDKLEQRVNSANNNNKKQPNKLQITEKADVKSYSNQPYPGEGLEPE